MSDPEKVRNIMQPKEPSFFSASFSTGGKTMILCTVFFALGVFVGRESVWYQLRRGMGGFFGAMFGG